MRKYTIENIFFTKSNNPNFKYDVCVVDYVDGKCYVTNLREKKYFLKSYGYNDIYVSPSFVFDELNTNSAREIIIQGFYKYIFSNRENKLSVRDVIKMQRFVDKHQPVKGKEM